ASAPRPPRECPLRHTRGAASAGEARPGGGRASVTGIRACGLATPDDDEGRPQMSRSRFGITPRGGELSVLLNAALYKGRAADSAWSFLNGLRPGRNGGGRRRERVLHHAQHLLAP